MSLTSLKSSWKLPLLRLYRPVIRLTVILVFLIGISIRLYAAFSEPILLGDAGSRYSPLAHNLVSGNGFSTDLAPPYAPNDFDQPGYPVFVATIYLLTGASDKAVTLVQLFLELGVLALTWLIAKELRLSARRRWLAVAIGWLCPFLALFALRILTEVLTTFILTLALYLVLLAVRTRRIAVWAIAGTSGGVCLLIRPDTLICIGLLAGATLISARSYKGTAVFCLLAALLLVPWTARGYAQFNAVRPLGRVTEQTNLAYVRWLDTWLDDPKYIQDYWWHKTETPGVDYQALADASRAAHPLRVYLLVPLKRTIMTVLRLPTYVGDRSLKLVAYFFWAALLILSLIGAVRLRKHPARLLLLALILGRFVLPLLTALAAEPRYIVEVLPVVCFLSASGLSIQSQRNNES